MHRWTVIIGRKSFGLSKWQVFILFLPFLSVVLFSLYCYGNIFHSTVVNINRFRLQKEKSSYTRKITETISLVEGIERRHSKIIVLDEMLRLALDIPYEQGERMFGTGGRYQDSEKDGKLINKAFTLDKKLERIKREVSIEEKSLIEIEHNFEISRDRLDHTPSIMPTWGRITSGFGHRRDPFTGRRTFHNGVDIANARGTPVVATASGEVTYAGRMGNLGLCVKIDHGYGYTTLYGHLKELNVRLYDKIKRGKIIGYMGNSGRSTAPHLHYGIKKYGRNVNPMDYILLGDVIY